MHVHGELFSMIGRHFIQSVRKGTVEEMGLTDRMSGLYFFSGSGMKEGFIYKTCRGGSADAIVLTVFGGAWPRPRVGYAGWGAGLNPFALFFVEDRHVKMQG